MPFLISFAAGAVAAITGLLIAGFLANACVTWYHVSSREGASGYFVLFLGLGGGIAGWIIGFAIARVVASQYGPGFLRETAAALGGVLLIGGVSACLCRWLADVPPTIDGRELNLEVEFRFPNTLKTEQPPTAEGEWEFMLASLSGNTCRKRNYGTIQTNAARLENGQWIVPATVLLFTERGGRSVSLYNPKASESSGFLLPIPRRPGRELLEWSSWFPRQQMNGQPWPADKGSCRYRLQQVPLPPPQKSYADLEAENAAQLEEEFNAIPADAPLEEWFTYFSHEQSHTQRALERVVQKPNWIAELTQLVLSEDPEVAHSALRCVQLLPNPPKELIGVLQSSARQIASKIERFNRTPKEADPDFATAVDPATRFYGWIPAAENLRKRCGADLIPELKNILELSKVRPESHCMRVDIGQLGTRSLAAWSGVTAVEASTETR